MGGEQPPLEHSSYSARPVSAPPPDGSISSIHGRGAGISYLCELPARALGVLYWLRVRVSERLAATLSRSLLVAHDTSSQFWPDVLRRCCQWITWAGWGPRVRADVLLAYARCAAALMRGRHPRSGVLTQWH